MMSFQNPSFPQNSYASGYGNAMTQQQSMQQFPGDFAQNQFQQPSAFPNNVQRPPQQFQQLQQGQIPPHLYQQYQQQQALAQQQQQQQQQGGFVRPQSRDTSGLAQAQASRQSPSNLNNQGQNPTPQGNARAINTPQPGRTAQQPNMIQHTPVSMAQGAPMPHIGTPSRNNSSSGAQVTMSPKMVAREEERVTTLLEINAILIQEAASLISQGKAGSTGQQSPTSPTQGDSISAASPGGDANKKQPVSPEYADCMRRLQTNLQYLAAIADANKKAGSARPVGPAIMVPPSHMQATLNTLYSKLKTLFPEASQSTLNKAMAVANAQAVRNTPM